MSKKSYVLCAVGQKYASDIKNEMLRPKIDLLAIQEKSLDRALFLYIPIREVRSSGVRASIIIVHIQKFYKM